MSAPTSAPSKLGLEREIGSVCRHVAMRLAEGEDVKLTCNSEFAQIVLGPAAFPASSAAALAAHFAANLMRDDTGWNGDDRKAGEHDH